jgi:hypothetical protein
MSGSSALSCLTAPQLRTCSLARRAKPDRDGSHPYGQFLSMVLRGAFVQSFLQLFFRLVIEFLVAALRLTGLLPKLICTADNINLSGLAHWVLSQRLRTAPSAEFGEKGRMEPWRPGFQTWPKEPIRCSQGCSRSAPSTVLLPDLQLTEIHVRLGARTLHPFLHLSFSSQISLARFRIFYSLGLARARARCLSSCARANISCISCTVSRSPPTAQSCGSCWPSLRGWRRDAFDSQWSPSRIRRWCRKNVHCEFKSALIRATLVEWNSE